MFVRESLMKMQENKKNQKNRNVGHCQSTCESETRGNTKRDKRTICFVMRVAW